MTRALGAHWPAIAIGLYFLGWAATGLRSGFSYDDVTNCYLAWVAPTGKLFREIVTVWSSQSRTVGGLFYRGVYGLVGFHPLAFRVACLALLLVNLVLLYRVFTAVGGSLGVAWAALLFGCFHGALWDIYTGTGMVFDILCGTFYYTALLRYVAWRRSGSRHTMRMAAEILLWTLVALGSKEMALSLPAVLLLYEGLFHPPETWRGAGRWALANAARIGPSALVCLAFVAGRLLIKGPLTGHPSYTPVFTLGRYLETTTRYTGLLFDRAIPFTPPTAAVFWAACLGLGVWARSRAMVFGILSFGVGMLPMSFVDVRQTGYVMYVPMFGLALYVGAGLDAVRERLRGRPRIAGTAAAAFVCAVVWTHYLEGGKLIRGQVGPGGQSAIGLTARCLPRVCARLAPGSRVLVVNSPFGEERYVPGFTLGLLYHSKEIHVVNAQSPDEAGSLADHFDHIFAYQDEGCSEVEQQPNQSALDALRPPAYLAMNSPLAYRSIVKGLSNAQGTGWRWTYQDSELRFTAPAGAKKFSMEFGIVETTFKRTGPLRVSFWIDGLPLGTRVFSQTGDQRVSLPLPAAIPAGKTVTAHMHVQNPYIAEADGARLGFTLTSAGLEP